MKLIEEKVKNDNLNKTIKELQNILNRNCKSDTILKLKEEIEKKTQIPQLKRNLVDSGNLRE